MAADCSRLPLLKAKLPETFDGVPEPRHLTRLDRVWLKRPVYFVTTCVADRRSFLANATAHAILREEWMGLRDRHGWAVGRYVVMPDHVHVFLAAELDAKPLTVAMGRWKEWTAKRLAAKAGVPSPLWQPEFFDHVLRSNESAAKKWAYVRENPVRTGLVAQADDWPYQGSIDFE